MEHPIDEVSLHIAAPAEALYDLVGDITQMGRWSPENTGGRWLGGAAGPAVGARFRGSNRRGIARWWTHCTVTKADRPSAFEFRVAESAMVWGYRFEPEGDGTLVTEYRRHAKGVNPVIKLVQVSGVIGRNREQLMVDGMRETLERLKTAAEGASTSA
jgi:uncharacterized protein YndB with AHSA1/START domain